MISRLAANGNDIFFAAGIKETGVSYPISMGLSMLFDNLVDCSFQWRSWLAGRGDGSGNFFWSYGPSLLGDCTTAAVGGSSRYPC